MRRRTINSFAKVGTVAMALVLSLGIMGIGYGVWSDSVSVINTVQTGTWGTRINNIGYSPAQPNTPLNCWGSTVNGYALHVAVDVTKAEASQEYDCTFTVINTGNVPIKIDVTYPPNPATGVTVRVTDTEGGSLEGAQIEPGAPINGVVHVYFASVPGSNFLFEVVFESVPWNQ